MSKVNNLLAILVIIFQGIQLQAQSVTEITTNSKTETLSCDPSSSSFVIQGTSSLHDWEMYSKSCKGKLEFDNGSNSINLESIMIKVGVTTLKSGKKLMDKKCYDALKHENHPNITYTLNKLNSISKDGTNKYKANLSGSLDIAGVKKTVNIDVVIEIKDGIVNIKGSKPLKMSDYDVEPPTALLGTIKTGNEITIIFNLNFVVS
jgi:polyisoprenoid-binding protein YceI